MVSKNEMMAEIGGAAVGALQTPLLRQYLDPKYPALIPQLGKFGTPSAIAGIAGGGIALAAALYANAKRKLTDIQISALETYGTVALVGGILSGFYPAVVAPVTVGLMPQVQTAQRTYVPPLVPSYNRMDLEAVQRMSGEIHRLSGENAQLRTMVQSMEVASKQRQYSFMDPNAQAMVAPGQPMPGAKAFGFMADGNPPLAKIQAMKSYGFLG